MQRPVSGSQTWPGCLQGKHSKFMKGIRFHYRDFRNTESFTAIVDKLQANLLVHPLCENPQNPAKHASQLVPPTPGLQGHCPVTSSQFCSIEPIRSHVHR